MTGPPSPRRRLARWLPGGPVGLRRSRSMGFATVSMVLVVVGAMAMTLFGAGAVSRTLNVYDGNVWLWSRANGSAQRVNTNAGQVDMHYALKDAKGNDVEVVQTDQHLLLHDRTAGTITSIDLSHLDVSASMRVQPGTNVSVAMWQNVVLLSDAPKGILRRLDPQKLSAKGEPLTFTPGLIPGKFDDDGRYWTVSPQDGAAIGVTTQPGSMKLKKDQTINVAPPDHNLKLSVLDHGAAIIDRTDNHVIVVNGSTTRKVSLPNLGDSNVAARTNGSAIAIAVPKSRQVVLIDGETVHTFSVPGSGELGQAIMFAGRLYVTDTTNNQILALDKSDTITDRVPTTSTNVTMEPREGVLAINQPDNATSYIVDKSHAVKKITKYANENPDKEAAASNKPALQTRPLGVLPANLVPTTSGDKGQQGRPRPSSEVGQPGGPQPGEKGSPKPPVSQPASTAVPANVRVRTINGGQNIQVTWDPVNVPPGAVLNNYNVYTCTIICVLVSSSHSTSATYSNPGTDNPVWFTVSSVINGQESAQSQRSNKVGTSS